MYSFNATYVITHSDVNNHLHVNNSLQSLGFGGLGGSLISTVEFLLD